MFATKEKKGKEKWGPRLLLRDSLKNGMISTDHAWGIDALSYQFKGSLSLLYSLLLLCSFFAKKEFQIRHFEELATALLLQATGENKIDLCTTSTLFPLCSSTKRENKMKDTKKILHNYRFLSAFSFLKIQFTNTQNLLFCSQSVRQKTVCLVG